jgi:hypothetical protein
VDGGDLTTEKRRISGTRIFTLIVRENKWELPSDKLSEHLHHGFPNPEMKTDASHDKVLVNRAGVFDDFRSLPPHARSRSAVRAAL